MKKYFSFAVLAMAVLAGCQKVDLSEVEPSDEGGSSAVTKKFTFTVKGDFGNPEFVEGGGAATRAYMQADGVDMTDLWVVDVMPDAEASGTGAGSSGTGAGSSGTVVQTKHLTPADAEWGAPVLQLKLGTHHVMFLASRGAGAQYQDGVVTWTKPLDTFYLDYEVTVAKTSNGNRAVTLDRVSTVLNLTIDDAIAEGVTEIKFTPATWYTGWNMLTGEAVSDAYYTSSVSIPASYVGQEGVQMNVWGLSGATEWTTNVGVSATKNGTPVSSTTIENAPFKANRKTKYHGMMFGTRGNVTLTLSDEWSADYEGEF